MRVLVTVARFHCENVDNMPKRDTLCHGFDEVGNNHRIDTIPNYEKMASPDLEAESEEGDERS